MKDFVANPASRHDPREPSLARRAGWWGLRALLLGLSVSQLGCKEMGQAFAELAAMFLAVLLVGMVVLAILGFILFASFLFSLALLAFNLLDPSHKTIVGAGVFSALFFGSGASIGSVMVLGGLHPPPGATGDPREQIKFGVVWAVLHFVYAACLAGSSVFGHQKLRSKGGLAPAPGQR